MEKEKQKEFRIELQKLCNKYEVKNAAFTGCDKESYIGLSCLDESPSLGSIMESVNNIGRLWQASRGIIADILNDFEKRK